MRISDWSSDVCSSDLGPLEPDVSAPSQLVDQSDDGADSGRTEWRQDFARRGARRCRTARSAGGGAGRSSRHRRNLVDRKSVVLGKSVSVRVDLGGRSIIKKKKGNNKQQDKQRS